LRNRHLAAVVHASAYTNSLPILPPQKLRCAKNWAAVASSADGTKLVAVAAGNVPNIYTSADSGSTWMAAEQSWKLWVTVRFTTRPILEPLGRGYSANSAQQ
jgi:hypothetical protein